VAVTEEKTVEACLSFVRDYHLLVGGSTGSVLAAAQQLAPEFRCGETIVALSADLGEKYLDTIYDPTWVGKVIAADGDKSERAHAFVAAEGNAQSTDHSCARRELVEPVRRNRLGLSGE
jgi:threonine synthase